MKQPSHVFAVKYTRSTQRTTARRRCHSFVTWDRRIKLKKLHPRSRGQQVVCYFAWCLRPTTQHPLVPSSPLSLARGDSLFRCRTASLRRKLATLTIALRRVSKGVKSGHEFPRSITLLSFYPNESICHC